MAESRIKVIRPTTTRKLVIQLKIGGVSHGTAIPADDVFAVVTMLTVTFVLLEPSRRVDVGETVQDDSAGAPVQVHVTERLKPPDGATEIVKFVDCPAEIVSEEGLKDKLKSDAGGLLPGLAF